MHLPNLKAATRARASKSSSPGAVTTATRRRPFARRTRRAATDWRSAVEDPEIDLVVIGTRHDTHAEIAAAALRAGKAVFVEKPLGLTREEIDEVWAAGRENDRLAIGFNRPFAPLAQRLGERGARAARARSTSSTASARRCRPTTGSTTPPRAAGGCSARHATCSTSRTGCAARRCASSPPRCRRRPTSGSVESASVTIEYADGSVATVHYSGVGAASMPKERVEVLRGGRSWVLDDFRSLTSYGADGESVETARPGQGPRRAARAACSRRAGASGRSSLASPPPTRPRASRWRRSNRSPPAPVWMCGCRTLVPSPLHDRTPRGRSEAPLAGGAPAPGSRRIAWRTGACAEQAG